MNTPAPESPSTSDAVPRSRPPAWLEDVEVRHLEEADLPALEWEGEYSRFRRLYELAYRRARAGKAVLWVACLPEPGVIGQLFVQLESTREELADGSERAYIHSFRLRPQYRGGGLGARMLAVAERDLIQRGFRSVTLNVDRDNPDAHRFYRRHGYQVVAPEPGRWTYFDEHGELQRVHEPAWRLEKSL